jgi:glycerol-3-phosphate dehydrogenase
MNWSAGWRDRLWSELDRPWDLLIVGGGVTGAGILREAARAGLAALLVEKGDFASGTSSRSSKMVHGGFRYLRNAQLRLTLESVRERQRLLQQGPGLIQPMDFLLANFRSDHIPAWAFGLGLALYDLFGRQWEHAHFSAAALREICPLLTSPQLRGGYRYLDAQVDDARLVLRLIQESVQAGAGALNYARARSLLRDQSGRVCGALLEDLAPAADGRATEVQAAAVVNAAGVWSDELRQQLDRAPRLRRLRGGHLLFPRRRVPLAQAVSFLHPRDARPLFIFPWEGVTLYGTTDVDHEPPLDSEVALSPQEAEYLLEGLAFAFPELELGRPDVQSTFAGIRPVVRSGRLNPSRESREHVLWREDGLLTVTGGKLTTFRIMAWQALRALRAELALPPSPRRSALNPARQEAALPPELDPPGKLRLLGRYGAQAPDLVAAARVGEFQPIGETPALWAELRWAARAEGVVHLDDLLMRRLRLGLTLPQGGIPCLPDIRAIVQPELGWSDARWEAEARAYTTVWSRYYAPPG